MSLFELHIHNLKDGSEHMVPFNDVASINGWLRMRPDFRFGHKFRIDIKMDTGGKHMEDVSDCLVLQMDPELMKK